MKIKTDYEYVGICKRVIDGDTIIVEVDLGFNIKHTISVRLMDVNAPEIFSGTLNERKLGNVICEYVSELCLGKPVVITTQKDRQSFNRYIADVWVLDGDKYVHLNQMVNRKIEEVVV